MDLNEAKQELIEHGYIIEDTETNDEEYDQIGKEIDDWEKDWYNPKARKLLKQHLSLSNKHMDLKDKIERAQDFNVDNRIENSSGFGTAIKNVYGKTILAELKKKALKKGFDQDYIDSVEETMLHDDKIFDTATDFIEDVTDENYDLERLNVNQLLKKYGDKALKYVLKEIFNYYYEA